eukprot:gene19691-biopygen16575
MNKNELVSAVAEKAGLTKADAASAVDAVFETVHQHPVERHFLSFGRHTVCLALMGIFLNCSQDVS